MTSVYITGVAGFLGSEIARQLLELNYHVYGCDTLITSDRENVPEGVIFKETDINFLHFGGVPDIIFHTAAIARSAWDDEKEIYRTNIHGTQNVVRLAKAHRSWLVNCSSCVVYQPQVNAYSMSKYLSENIAQSYEKSTSLRYTNIYGPGQSTKGAEPNVLARWKMQRDAGEKITVHGDGSQLRMFVHVRDAARAAIMSAYQTGVFDVKPVFLFSNISIGDIAKKFGDVEYIPHPRPGDPENWYENVSNYRYVPGWVDEITLREGLKEILA